MKLTIKTFRQETYEIVIDAEETIYSLKCYLQKLTNNQLPADRITLIYSGLILDDTRTIQSYNVNESKFIVVLMRSIGTQPELHQNKVEKPSRCTLVDFKTDITDKPRASKNFTNIRAEAINNPTTAVSLQTVTDPSYDRFRSTERLINTEQINRSIQNIVDAFGYPENEVRHAFAASFNNPDLTVDFLINGIPSDELVQIGLDLGAIETSLAEEWPNLIDITSAGLTAANVSTTPTATPLQFLRSNSRFQRMRIALRRNPNLLTIVINRIADTNIGLFNLIRENQDEFVNMINEPIGIYDDDYDDGSINQSNETNKRNEPNNSNDYHINGNTFVQNVPITPEDDEAIKRLMDLGFSDYLCVEAYFVCDKDEERAANFLLSHTENEI